MTSVRVFISIFTSQPQVVTTVGRVLRFQGVGVSKKEEERKKESGSPNENGESFSNQKTDVI